MNLYRLAKTVGAWSGGTQVYLSGFEELGDETVLVYTRFPDAAGKYHEFEVHTDDLVKVRSRAKDLEVSN